MKKEKITTDDQEPPKVEEVKGVNINVNHNTDSLKELIEKNIKWSQVIYEQNKKIKRRLDWMIIAGYLKLLIIIAPIILALIYLPPILKDLINQYSNLVGSIPFGGGANGQVNEVLSQVSGSQLEGLLESLGIK